MIDNRRSNEPEAFSRLFSEGGSQKIRELVQELNGLMRDNNIDAIARSYDYLRQWLAENIELDGVDRQYAFYNGFILGIAVFRELYNSSDRRQKKEEG